MPLVLIGERESGWRSVEDRKKMKKMKNTNKKACNGESEE